MKAPPEMQCPAPRVNAGDRAECNTKPSTYTVIQGAPEDPAARWLSVRFGIAPCIARVLAAAAGLGGRLA